ncbi:hypothetical protein B0J15DRAFT_566994 [Fusarium solani]|uniref:Uncharacterized protein n=1 Tax=Fusarium solani TaxID=169388 RepID=A0A9P9RC79_FUSSL|nr:uncharacterized protein B0J15DRAFT_566994 [Fusarium solani]KAH7273667.1 hypothetical protein B0J15DRAFT_566994 [Fusarium solani]
MTGKPSYQANEIQFALELMLQDLYNEQISDAFDQRFGRPLTDNQIRYLRNKYGKDPDFGAPLVNRPASKKLKRRRAEPPEPPRPEKRARYEVPTATAPVTPAEVAPSPAVEPQQLKLPQQGHELLPTVVETIVKKEEIASPTPSQAYVLSPTAPASSLPAAHQAQEGGYVPRTTAGPLYQQQQATWNKNFHPISTTFGQTWVASPAEESPGLSTTPTPTPNIMSPPQQPCFFPSPVNGLRYRPHNIQPYHHELLFQPPATLTDVPQNAPQSAEIVQTGLMLTQTDEEAATQHTIPSDEVEWRENLTQDVNTTVRQVLSNPVGKRQLYSQQRPSDSPPMPQTTNRSAPQESLTNYGYTFQTPSTPTLIMNTLDPRLFEESTDSVTSLKGSFTHT